MPTHLSTIRERDIDLLLIEELSVSIDFFNWLIRQTTKARQPKLTEIWHSKSDPQLGESDIVLVYKSQNRKISLLIENKIDAIPQPKQAQRYKERGEKGIKEGKWKEYQTCLVAPKKYLDKTENADQYDYQLSYESIKTWFKKKRDKRSKYKVNLIKEGIEQSRKGYIAEIDEHMTEFWLRYYETATEQAPKLRMKKPSGKPARSLWINFKPKELPKGMRLLHKVEKGYVDLELSGQAKNAKTLIPSLQKKLPKNVEIAITGKSIVIRKELEPINDFDEEKEKVEIELRHAIQLLNLSKKL